MKTKRIAVAVVHGIGNQKSDFADSFSVQLKKYFAKSISAFVKDPEAELVIKPVYWAPVLARDEDLLRLRLKKGGRMDYKGLRNFMLDFAADAVAYQPTASDKQAYAEIHGVFAQTLSYLALEAGSDAPLAVVSHSLGTVISSNYIYDLQNDAGKALVPVSVKAAMGVSPLERGDTFSRFYTLGSPIALWGLRYNDFGVSIQMPPEKLHTHHPNVKGEWLNFYDPDDVIGYPLKSVNSSYDRSVTKDVQVNIGGLLSFWNPLSHSYYLDDKSVIVPVAQSLVSLWKEANGVS